MTEEVKEVKKPGPKWSLGKTFPTYEEATNQVEVLKNSFTENKQENMQTKIRRKANGTFLVKYRKDPAFAKETKNGSGNKKNKRNTKKEKLTLEEVFKKYPHLAALQHEEILAEQEAKKKTRRKQ